MRRLPSSQDVGSNIFDKNAKGPQVVRYTRDDIRVEGRRGPSEQRIRHGKVPGQAHISLREGSRNITLEQGLLGAGRR